MAMQGPAGPTPDRQAPGFGRSSRRERRSESCRRTEPSELASRGLLMEVTRLDSLQKLAQDILRSPRGPNNQTTIRDRDVHRRSSHDFRLSREGLWNPQRQAVAPLLNFRDHAPSGYTINIH